MSEGTGRSLTRQEFDAVIRRAVELATNESEGSEGALTESEVFRIAREVGLSDRHVRQALSDVRMEAPASGFLDRIFGPAQVRAARVVPGSPSALAGQLDDFLVGTQLLQRVRRSPSLLQYRPSVDWASQLARAASFTQKKYYVASAKSVEVRLEALEEGYTHVELWVDPGTRGDSMAGAFVGGGVAGTALGVGTAVMIVMSGGGVLLGVGAGVALGGGLTGGITSGVGSSHKRKLLEVQAELEGLLDRLEHGESLEPPPASWRSWVKRQFHGVARDLLSTQWDEDESSGRRGGGRR